MISVTYTAAKGLKLLATEIGAWMDATDGTTDITGNSNDLTENGTVLTTAVNNNSELLWYYSFSAANYFSRAYDADFDPGTGEIRIRFHLEESANSGTEIIYERDSNPTAQRVTIEINAAGNLIFTCDDNTTVRSVTSTIVIDDDVERYFECVYSAGTLYIYIDEALDNSATGTALLTLSNASAVIYWGRGVVTANPLTNGNLTLVGISLTASTVAQVLTIYESEKILFRPERVYTQVDQSYSLDLYATALAPSNKTFKQVQNSLGRNRSTLVHGEDFYWDVNTLPVTGIEVDRTRRFLESAIEGIPFTFDPNGTIAVPYDPVLCDLELDSFPETRLDDTDYFSFSFKVREL